APAKAKVLVIGVAYKKDLDDWRESPSIAVINCLLNDKVNVAYHDPYVSEIQVAGQTFKSVDLIDEVLVTADLVIIATDHSQIDYINLVEKSKAVLDTRGVTRKLNCNQEKVTLL
ncbi:MAG TPA: UDP-N-acetyl-D-glucosamine dehydrogenase, partial [Cyanobacteria bacterium UBA11148]|nr:UDP-N-acetyl-D-glucosamine dehydrogenase [Cyanobacteria bacterium UBA11148]